MRVKNISLRLLALVAMTTVGLVLFADGASAATLSVNSNGDIAANDGAYTLREAIISANTDAVSGAAVGECAAGSGTDTINFAITGPADFTNGGQNGHTIAPTSALPDITEPVVINGYSQTGAQANTAAAPLPMNGILLIELDGTNAGAANGLNFRNNSDGSTVRGLVINNYGSGDALSLLADDIQVQGNYIGTNPAGTTARPNTVGVNTYVGNPNIAQNVLVGGLNPADRNLISGNTSGSSATASYPSTGWVFQGNYIGVAADGLTAISNSTNAGSGALSIDNCSDVVVGGSQPGAINVIGASLGHGLAPDQATNVTMEGNYIGLGYDGTTVLGNVTGGSNGSGFSVSNLTNSTIKNNLVAGWKTGGISLNQNVTNVTVEGNIVHDNLNSGIGLGSTGVSNITLSLNQIRDNQQHGINQGSVTGGVITSNTITGNGGDGMQIGGTGTIIRGNTIKNNTGSGISLLLSSGNTVGGSLAGQRNIISGNTGYANILIYGAVPFGSASDDNTIQGNYIGTNDSGSYDPAITQFSGIVIYGDSNDNLIGGVNSAEANIIAGNVGAGVITAEFELPTVYTGTPARNSILGNKIFNNQIGNTFGLPLPGLGIDDMHFVLDPNTFLPPSVTNEGPNPNDFADPDTGPNNYLNFPVINAATQTNSTLAVNFDLDAADSTDGNYRVEFFANDSADPSGYGEGQTYLGSATVNSGSGQETTLTLANGTDLTGKSITATATAVNNTTTSGFGATSEFSLATNITVTSVSGLADTGQSILQWLAGVITLAVAGIWVGLSSIRAWRLR